MSKLPRISGQKCVQALSKIGFEVRNQQGSHIILVRESPKTRLSVPNHKELDKGTLRAIIRQAGLTVEQFIQLL
jgi:predicted RNA binding protein YcfA (HicA-like mRNA interferase family)